MSSLDGVSRLIGHRSLEATKTQESLLERLHRTANGKNDIFCRQLKIFVFAVNSTRQYIFLFLCNLYKDYKR